MNKYSVTSEVYSLNNRRNDLDLPPLQFNAFEYEINLLCGHCGQILDSFDSQEGLQPFQLCYDETKAIQNAEQTRLAVESSIVDGSIDTWFQHIKNCDCMENIREVKCRPKSKPYRWIAKIVTPRGQRYVYLDYINLLSDAEWKAIVDQYSPLCCGEWSN